MLSLQVFFIMLTPSVTTKWTFPSYIYNKVPARVQAFMSADSIPPVKRCRDAAFDYSNR